MEKKCQGLKKKKRTAATKIKNFAKIKSPKLLPANFRNRKEVTLQTLKRNLDDFLTSASDEPMLDGLVKTKLDL